MKYTKIVNKGTIIHRSNFDSIGEFLTYLEETSVNRFFKDKSLGSESYGESWSGTNTLDEAKDLLQHGWMPDSEKLKKQLKLSNTVQAQGQRKMPVYGMAGYQASVPRYLNGIPTAMINSKFVPVKKKVITITKDITYDSSWSETKIIDEAIKALQIVQALEVGGLRIKLNIYLGTGANNEQIQMKLCIKQPDERMNFSKLAFPLGHPAMLRRFLFAFIERHQEVNTSYYSRGYGYPVPIVAEKDEYILPHMIDNPEQFIAKLLK